MTTKAKGGINLNINTAFLYVQDEQPRFCS